MCVHGCNTACIINCLENFSFVVWGVKSFIEYVKSLFSYKILPTEREGKWDEDREVECMHWLGSFIWENENKLQGEEIEDEEEVRVLFSRRHGFIGWMICFSPVKLVTKWIFKICKKY